MKSLAEQMSIYQKYHTKTLTKLTHFVGVPFLILSLLLILQHFPMQSLISIIIGVLLLYYLYLDLLIGAVTALFFLALLYVAQSITLHTSSGLNIFITVFLFSFGWIAQVVGHYHEQKRPAFMDNFFQIFIAPIFLIAEIFFIFGYKKELQREVITLSQE